MLVEPVHDAVEVGVACAQYAREPVPAAFGDLYPVRDDVELTSSSRRGRGINSQALLDEGHETRGLGLVVLSHRAIDDLNLHRVLLSILRPSSSFILSWYAC